MLNVYSELLLYVYVNSLRPGDAYMRHDFQKDTNVCVNNFMHDIRMLRTEHITWL